MKYLLFYIKYDLRFWIYY